MSNKTMSTSTATTDKYAVVQNYPEVAPVMTQPPLEHYNPPQQPQPQYHQPPYQYQNGYPQEELKSASPPQKRNPWGLSPLAFGLLVAAITAVVVGAAVGGGVAGAMSGDDSKSSSVAGSTTTVTAGPTATTTVTGTSSATGTALPLPSSLENYVAAEPLYVASLANPGCADSNIDGPYDTSFNLLCGVDMQNNIPDETNPDLVVADFVALFAYSITDCVYACANANHFVDLWGQDKTGGNMQSCKGITWQMQMASSNSSNFANCWLKNGTVEAGYQCNNCISAKLKT